ncbi:hypothetical protein FPZ42_04990 [Mucilaginibacter achroorhodeus]|uniref:Class I SAM-dependent methyltransferase n=1 Tax=Mucilaginibacter achroorhodeus TaxID=2599294 RepID=A0A563UB10_9SPHI|nr:TylF/MycF/NovP-related O-methyltransferase [Mucilaginibacter achroorhodeus]TWR28572.1 hypothetical protein FPZ42_04990 [Mucilaginibacter achroorhodeus]
MNNYFITQYPFSINPRKNSALIGFINKGLRYLKTGYQVGPLDTSLDMNTVEQRVNYYHLLEEVIAYEVAGDVVELGTFTGQCAALFQKVIEQTGSDKQLHVYDTFATPFTFKGDVEQELIRNFKVANLKQPQIHKGLFEDTLAKELPSQIAFAHIDCGFGGDPNAHKKIMLYCFEQLYPRLEKGAICVLMDYNDSKENGVTLDINPGVKMAFDEFFAGKAEKIVCLYGNQYQHAFFRKK